MKERMGKFLQAIQDEDMGMRKVAFNSVAHNKRVLVRDLLQELFPMVCRETQVRVSEAPEEGPSRGIFASVS